VQQQSGKSTKRRIQRNFRKEINLLFERILPSRKAKGRVLFLDPEKTVRRFLKHGIILATLSAMPSN